MIFRGQVKDVNTKNQVDLSKVTKIVIMTGDIGALEAAKIPPDALVEVSINVLHGAN